MMGVETRFPMLLVLLAFFLVTATSAGGERDPELLQCKHQCRVQQQFDERQIRECEDRCEKYRQEKQRREGEHEGGGAGNDEPGDHLKQCMRRCDREQEWQQPRCQKQCFREYVREKQEERGEGGGGSQRDEKDPRKEFQQCRERCRVESRGPTQLEKCERRCEERRREREGQGQGGDFVLNSSVEEEKVEENPYVFEEQHFMTVHQNEHGWARALRKFTHRSNLFRGIENYRLLIVEAEPHTFLTPHHKDVESIIFVANGRGTMSLVREDKRESFNIKEGDILRLESGITNYAINRDKTERLILVYLTQSVFAPGEVESFFGPGGENPESYLRGGFSDEVLEAAWKTRGDRLEKLWKRRSEGAIIKASEQQIQELSRHEEGGVWPFTTKTKGPVNIFEQGESKSNEYGKFLEIDANKFDQLRDLDVSVNFVNISRGSMSAPMYNSRATKVALVLEGEGYFEMACPHLADASSESSRERAAGGSKQERKVGRISYKRVTAGLRRGTAVLNPPGHPFVAVASSNQNLQVLCFEINSRNNHKFPLAGTKNIWKELEKEAKELSFGLPAQEVDQILDNQDKDLFFRGPRQQRQHQGRSDE